MKIMFCVVVFACLINIDYASKIKEGNSIWIEPSFNYTSDNYLTPGTSKSIKCKATSKAQKLEWLDPFENIIKKNPANRVFVQEHFTQIPRTRLPALILTFKSVSAEDTGPWECRSGNVKKSVNLCVIEPSYFVETQENVTTNLGRSITLSCQARGSPEPRIEWRRNGKILTDEETSSKYKLMTKYNTEGFEGLLTITSLERQDGGVYTCDAVQESLLEDCRHTESFNVTLNIKFAPVFEDDDIEYVYTKVDDYVELVCIASAYPTPNYSWFEDKKDLFSVVPVNQVRLKDDAAVLTLKVNASTIGTSYMCRVSNELGESQKEFVVLKIEKPNKKPNQINLYNSTHEQIQFNVSWHDTINFPIEEFHIQYLEAETLKRRKVHTPRESDWRSSDDIYAEIDDGEGIFVTLRNLATETEYWVRMRAVNEEGASPWSDPVLASTTAEVEPEVHKASADVASEHFNNEYKNTLTYGLLFVAAMVLIVFACTYCLIKH